MNLRDILSKQFLFLDGAMGTMLQKSGLKRGEIPETYNILKPEIIKGIHKKYIEAGANIVTTNTFGANELKLKATGYSVEEIIESGVKIAKNTEGEKLVALDIGPIGKMLEPTGNLSFERAYEIFKRQVIAGDKSGCDLILIETMSDLYEVKAAVLAAKENSNLPVFCTMTFGSNGRTFTGTDPLSMVTLLEGLSVDALGINCSLGPKEAINIVEKILKYTSVPVIVQPNAGLPKMKDGETYFDISPDEFAFYQNILAEKGACILGGCCGTTDKYIKAIVEKLKNKIPLEVREKEITAVCSPSKTVIIGEKVKIVGERINPTGKDDFKKALITNNIEFIVKEAILQRESGADILDINLGLPEINEKDLMVKVIKRVQEVINLPLQIDSADKFVIEKAVRIYNGKPIINSVNGTLESMKNIFPIAKRYGASLIALTLDEKGIPSKAEDKVKITEKIINKAKEYGIKKKDIIVDCLVLTASTNQSEVMETLQAMKMIKMKFKVKTLLGISNISFGLPNRESLNSTFLTMALCQGLDLPIINPNDKDIMDTIRSFNVLADVDKEAEDFIKSNSNKKNVSINNPTEVKMDLTDMIIKGFEKEAEIKTLELLKREDSIDIVDKYLIPSLDIIGKGYEKGDIFLPQLMKSGATVKKSFKIIKEHLKKQGNKTICKGKIILATVKGDIHDIGKNIVKALLENYGFKVIDLGNDISTEKIIESIKKEKAELVGLSALMTTTVKNMEQTIKIIRKNKINCKIFVGGAVLNEEYAKIINADYYAKDAKQAVDIAKKVFKI